MNLKHNMQKGTVLHTLDFAASRSHPASTVVTWNKCKNVQNIRHEFKTQNAANSKEGYHVPYNLAGIILLNWLLWKGWGMQGDIITCAKRYPVKTKMYKVLDMKIQKATNFLHRERVGTGQRAGEGG